MPTFSSLMRMRCTLPSQGDVFRGAHEMQTLAAMSRHAPPEQRPWVVQRVLDETLNHKKGSNINVPSEVRRVLDEVPLEFAHETLKAARRIADDWPRTTTLAALVPSSTDRR